MKSFAIACAALMLFAATASAGDLAVSKSTLGSMGLGSMQQMSDDEGTAVRGKGTFAGVWGASVANWHGGQSATNNYEAGAQWLGKGSSAGGNSLSAAGKVQIQLLAEGAFPGPYAAAQLSVGIGAGLSGGFANAWAN